MQKPDFYSDQMRYFLSFLEQFPSAFAELRGGEGDPGLRGRVLFYQTGLGVLVAAQAVGLPTADAPCRERIFALHIHEGSDCGDPGSFSAAGEHYNPGGCEHPNHAGDLPPLFGCAGTAFGSCLTNRFTVREILGRTVILHAGMDDFTSQPAGNAGPRIACGVITRF